MRFIRIFIMTETTNFRHRVGGTDDYRIEVFAKTVLSNTVLTNVTLKMGCFRVRRSDNRIGERYFVGDLRQPFEMSNALLVHSDKDKETLGQFKLEPDYECQRLQVHRFGQHANVDGTKMLEIDHRGLTVTTTSKE